MYQQENLYTFNSRPSIPPTLGNNSSNVVSPRVEDIKLRYQEMLKNKQKLEF